MRTDSLLSGKAVGGICGAWLTNVVGWLFSGVFIPIDFVVGGGKTRTNRLPFYQSTEAIGKVLTGNLREFASHFAVVLGYPAEILALAGFMVRRRMNGDKA